MVKNNRLKHALQSLAKPTLSIYKDNVSMDEAHRTSVAIALYKLDNLVKEIPEYSVCVSLMEKDEKIKALQGKLIGTCTGRSIVENEEACILSFLRNLYFKNQKYEQGVFDREYALFEDLFYSDSLHFIDSATLYNFEFDGDKIELESGLSIRQDTRASEPRKDFLEGIHQTYALFSKSHFVIKRQYDLKKRVGDISKFDKEETIADLSRTGDLFDLIITSLRILKPSAVYRDHKVKSELITFHPCAGISTRAPFYENIVIGKKCIVSKEDVEEFKKIFAFLIHEDDSRFKVAKRRLSLGMERKEVEDQLIDYMIGFEALYLPDGNQELSFRLSLRVAFLLCSDPNDRKDTYYFLKCMYKTRSDIVHGSKYDLESTDIDKLEELLRKSIRLSIDDNNNFSTNKFTNSGKIKTEGQLDNLFFDV